MRTPETFWTGKTVFVTGGASFIGSTLTDQLVARGVAKVRIVDDLSSGQLDNIRQHLGTGKVDLLQADLREPGVTRAAMKGVDTVFHLAADRRAVELDRLDRQGLGQRARDVDERQCPQCQKGKQSSFHGDHRE